MEESNSVKMLNVIDTILSKRTVTRKIGDKHIEFKEYKHSFSTMKDLVDLKHNIILDLIKAGKISKDEEVKYWLSEDSTFTPKINE